MKKGPNKAPKVPYYNPKAGFCVPKGEAIAKNKKTATARSARKR